MKKLLLVTILCSLWTLVVAQGIILEGTGGIGYRSYNFDGVFLPYDAGPYGSQEYFAKGPVGGAYDFDIKFGISPFKNSNLYFIGEYGLLNNYDLNFSSGPIAYGSGSWNNWFYRSIYGEYRISSDYRGAGILYVMFSEGIAGRFAATIGETTSKIDIPYKVKNERFTTPTNPEIIDMGTIYYNVDSGLIINTSLAFMPRNGGITIGGKYTFTTNHISDLNKDISSSTISAFLGYNFIARMDTGKRAIQKAIKQAMRNPNIRSYSRIAVMLPIENQTMRERYISDIEFVLLRENYIPVDRNAIDTALRRAEVDQSRNQAWVFDDRTALTAGRETQAQYILTGNLETIGGKRRLSIRVLEAETGDVVGRAFIDNI